jgi:hypothetical protein
MGSEDEEIVDTPEGEEEVEDGEKEEVTDLNNRYVFPGKQLV